MLKNILKLILKIWWHQQIIKFQQLIKYCVVGVFGAIIDIVALWFLVEICQIYYLTSATISFILAVINNYFLNKYWTFKDESKRHFAQFANFFLISVIGLFINLVIIYLLVEKLAIYYLISKFIAIIIVTFWNFLMNKYITFKKYEK